MIRSRLRAVAEDCRRTLFECNSPPVTASACCHPRVLRGPDRLEVAINEAIAACGDNVRDALKAMIVANEFLELEVRELRRAVSHAYTRGRFKTYTG